MPHHTNRLRKFWEMVYRWLLVRGFSHEEAEDKAQELTADVPPEVLAGTTARWRAWVRKAATNKGWDYVRRTYAEKKALAEYLRRWLDRTSSVPITDEAAEWLLSAVGETLSRLHDDERHILFLRYWLGYSAQEIADELNVDVAAARKRLQRARDRFRDEWDEGPQGQA